jgi:hypothetical protein
LRRWSKTSAALVLLAALISCSGGSSSSSKRDEGAFLISARETSGRGDQIESDRAWILSHPHDTVAEGDRACSWIRSQPTAPPRDPRGQYSVEALGNRYVAATESAPIAKVSALNRAHVAIEAWANLCAQDRRLHYVPASPGD